MSDLLGKARCFTNLLNKARRRFRLAGDYSLASVINNSVKKPQGSKLCLWYVFLGLTPFFVTINSTRVPLVFQNSRATENQLTALFQGQVALLALAVALMILLTQLLTSRPVSQLVFGELRSTVAVISCLAWVLSSLFGLGYVLAAGLEVLSGVGYSVLLVGILIVGATTRLVLFDARDVTGGKTLSNYLFKQLEWLTYYEEFKLRSHKYISKFPSLSCNQDSPLRPLHSPREGWVIDVNLAELSRLAKKHGNISLKAVPFDFVTQEIRFPSILCYVPKNCPATDDIIKGFDIQGKDYAFYMRRYDILARFSAIVRNAINVSDIAATQQFYKVLLELFTRLDDLRAKGKRDKTVLEKAAEMELGLERIIEDGLRGARPIRKETSMFMATLLNSYVVYMGYETFLPFILAKYGNSNQYLPLTDADSTEKTVHFSFVKNALFDLVDKGRIVAAIMVLRFLGKETLGPGDPKPWLDILFSDFNRKNITARNEVSEFLRTWDVVSFIVGSYVFERYYDELIMKHFTMVTKYCLSHCYDSEILKECLIKEPWLGALGIISNYKESLIRFYLYLTALRHKESKDYDLTVLKELDSQEVNSALEKLCLNTKAREVWDSITGVFDSQ